MGCAQIIHVVTWNIYQNISNPPLVHLPNWDNSSNCGFPFPFQENKLRLAVLDYLKRFHPTDSDTYTMVSLHFTMYREIAQMLEENAVKLLNSLKHKPLGNYVVQVIVLYNFTGSRD
jgi:hypothetical protein